MYQVLSASPIEPTDGHVDLDFRRPEAWGPTQDGGGQGLAIMCGDEHAGPFVYLSCFPPMEDEMPRSFAHAHASDNWRISVRGTTNMGTDAYADGQFRFHDGGVPYASDNFAWGPDGGFGIIMFADRRGFAIQPVKSSIAERLEPQQRAVGEILGIDMMDPCPGAPAIVTTFGPTARGHLNQGFETAADWDVLVPGVRLSAALMGEREVGPAMLLIDADQGSVALPERVVGTEVLAALVAGSVSTGEVELDQGSVRLDESGVSAPAMVAGDDGAQLVVIVADRRALVDAVDGGAMAGWSDALRGVLDSLRDGLAA